MQVFLGDLTKHPVREESQQKVREKQRQDGQGVFAISKEFEFVSFET